MPANYPKSGYLLSDFRLFYNADTLQRNIAPHYHDFHKIMIFLGGNVSYHAEGRQYELQPGDIMLISAGDIHYPVIHDRSVYKRIILYISQAFFDRYRTDDLDLFSCFERIRESGSHLLRPTGGYAENLRQFYPYLKASVSDQGPGADLLRRARLTELMVLLCRIVEEIPDQVSADAGDHPMVRQVMDYINANISDDTLCIDRIAKSCGLGRSYLMHLFKAETGSTVGHYITEKRLFLAGKSLEEGESVTDVCYRSGFANYSAFYYAYKKKYGRAPAAGRQTAKKRPANADRLSPVEGE